jgi:hypothetical protein
MVVTGWRIAKPPLVYVVGRTDGWELIADESRLKQRATVRRRDTSEADVRDETAAGFDACSLSAVRRNAV